MTNLMKKASGWLKQSLGDGAGVSVTYSRGATHALIVAWVGNTLFAGVQRGGVGGFVQWGERDYLIPISQIADQFDLPQVGDRITEQINGHLYVFEIVVPAGTGDPAWRYSDSNRGIARVHCKRVG